jgi:hypothetical protein
MGSFADVGFKGEPALPANVTLGFGGRELIDLLPICTEQTARIEWIPIPVISGQFAWL